MNVEIPTNRLLLRPVQATDADAMVAGLGNFAVARWTGRVPSPYHLSDALDFIAFTAVAEAPSRFMAITRKADPDSLIGIISYQYQAAQGDAELGYWLAEPWWRQGFGREAAIAMTEHAFDVDGLECLIASYQDGNTASARILDCLGFETVQHGTGFSRAQGCDVPVIFLSLSRAQWHMKRAAGSSPAAP